MQGVFVYNKSGGGRRRPASKKVIRDLLKTSPEMVVLERTSLVGGNEWNGPVTEMPFDQPAYFVGPDPFRDRRFYGAIVRRRNGKLVLE